MRMALLASGNGWHVADLARAAQQCNVPATIVDFRSIQTAIGIDRCDLQDFDAVLVRTMPIGSLEQVIFRMDVLHRLQAQGVRILNPPLALETCIDKYLALVRLSAAGLHVPRTIVCQRAEDAMQAIEHLGGVVVVKPLFGSEGRGMLRIDDVELAWRTFKTLERIQAVIYLQEFIAHPGWDLRVFVLGGRVLTAMKRHAAGGWRTNVAQGGRGEHVVPSDEAVELALRAAKATGVVVGGVDLLLGPEQRWYVLEVNAVPGWRTLSHTCNVDVALEIMKFVLKA